MDVIFTDNATNNINKITAYISEQGYPERAIEYSEELYDFCKSLGYFPLKYNICRFKRFAKRNLRCAVYQNYIFAYLIDENQIFIYNIIHSKRLKY